MVPDSTTVHQHHGGLFLSLMLSTLYITFLSSAVLFSNILSNNKVIKTVGQALPASEISHESPFGPILGLTHHSSFIRNLRVRHGIDLYRTDPGLLDLLHLFQVHASYVLSLFCLGLSQDQLLALFELVGKILLLDTIIFNGGHGKALIQDTTGSDYGTT